MQLQPLSGAIGASLSYSSGAKLADPASTVLLMLGDWARK